MKEHELDAILWVVLILSSAALLGLLAGIKDNWLKKLAEKKDKKFFERALFGLLSSKQPKKQKGNPIINIDNMTGIQFEVFLKEMFKTLGYRVRKTPDSGDYGADLYMEKDGKKYVVQSKKYKDKVGLGAVQEVVAAKAHYKAENAIVITNSQLTGNAKILAKNNNVIVYERPELIKLIQKSKIIAQSKHHNLSKKGVVNNGR